MSDIGTGSKGGKGGKGGKKKGGGPRGWNAAADGASFSKTFPFTAPAESTKFAKRALHLAQKTDQSVDLRYSGAAVTVGLAASGGALSEGQRRMARRLEGKPTDEDKAAKVAAKAKKTTAKAAKTAPKA